MIYSALRFNLPVGQRGKGDRRFLFLSDFSPLAFEYISYEMGFRLNLVQAARCHAGLPCELSYVPGLRTCNL